MNVRLYQKRKKGRPATKLKYDKLNGPTGSNGSPAVAVAKSQDQRLKLVK